MDLTNDDVADILALLDSLPYDTLDLRTDRFRLTLRRTPAGWTEESELLVEPTDVTADARASAGTNAPDGAAAREGVARANGSVGASEVIEAERGAEPGGAAGTAGAVGAVGGASDGAHGARRLVAVVAPLPGTFYRAPRPGAPPFVEVGDVVGADTVVAIIETMKLMNSVHAGTAGRVARILSANGEFTPLGAAVLLIDPDPATSSDPDS